MLAALIVAALFWGNCFSCPQLLLAASSKAPHSCCKRPLPMVRTCANNALRHFVKADPVSVAAPAVAPAAIAMFTPAPPAQPMLAAPVTLHSPPDLLELNSILRV